MKEFSSIVHFMRFLGFPAFVVVDVSTCATLETAETGKGGSMICSSADWFAVALLGVTLRLPLTEGKVGSFFEQALLPLACTRQEFKVLQCRFTWRFLRFKEFKIELLLPPESVEQTVDARSTRTVWDSEHCALPTWGNSVLEFDIVLVAFYTYCQVLNQPLLTWRTDAVGVPPLTWGLSCPEMNTGFGSHRGI